MNILTKEVLQEYDSNFLAKRLVSNALYKKRVQNSKKLTGSWELEIKVKDPIDIVHYLDDAYYKKFIIVGSDITQDSVSKKLRDYLSERGSISCFSLKKEYKKRERKALFKHAYLIIDPVSSKEFMKKYSRELTKQKAANQICDFSADNMFKKSELGKIRLKDLKHHLKLKLGSDSDSYESLCSRVNSILEAIKENKNEPLKISIKRAQGAPLKIKE